MSADFWASYVSGALGICIGNRLDILKTELQAGNRSSATGLLDHNETSRLQRLTSLFRGAAAPILGYGALNSILFITYNRTLSTLDPSIPDYNKLAGVSLDKIWLAGAVGGLACWIVSAPSELIKCRAQLMVDGGKSSYDVLMDTLKRTGLRGLYLGGTITSLRDAVGYGWYFWTYELSKRLLLSRQPDPFAEPRATDVLIAGGIAGVVTWASIYPLDVIKTRLQTQSAVSAETAPLLDQTGEVRRRPQTSWAIARNMMRNEGVTGFYRGLGICSLRAFIVNAAQWYIYERSMAWFSFNHHGADLNQTAM